MKTHSIRYFVPESTSCLGVSEVEYKRVETYGAIEKSKCIFMERLFREPN